MGYVVLFAISGSCSEKPNNWIFIQFTIIKNMLDMFADGSLGLAEQLAKLFL